VNNAFGQENDNVAEILFDKIEPPVVAQWDISVFAPRRNLDTEKRALECSGIVSIGDQLIILSDRHDHIVFSSTIDLQKMTITTPQPHVVIRNEQQLLRDAESITFKQRPDGKYDIFAMCSLGNTRDELPLPQRRHMLHFTLEDPESFTFSNVTVFNASKIREELHKYFVDLNVEFYRTYTWKFPGENKNTYRWGHLEGISFSPDGSVLLGGMRNPLHEGKAFVFAVNGIEESIDNGNDSMLELVDLFLLDLGGRGISDLYWDPVTQGYLITAAKSNGPKLDNNEPYPPRSLDSALFWWSGNKLDEPILFAKIPDMSVETVCRLANSRFIIIGSDESDYSENRDINQSILTVMDFTGIAKQ